MNVLDHLKVLLNGEHAADVRRAGNGDLSLAYTPAWVANPTAYPVSLTMPVRPAVYKDKVVAPFLAGLLPDSNVHRARLGQLFNVSGDNDFSLLSEIGRECAGAISIVRPDEPDSPELAIKPTYDVLPEDRVAQMIRDLPERPLLADGNDMRLSLAGVNDKVGVLWSEGNVALPTNGTPSTHILKIDIKRLPDSARLENFCLRLAGAVGIKVPKSRIGVAEDLSYLLVARYDRALLQTQEGPRLRRLHQEDFCQALGYAPNQKYERDGGPGWAEAFRLMKRMTNPIEARQELLSRAIFTYLVGNPDAHAKNYSILFRAGKATLAPCYDLNNAKAFVDCFKSVRPRMAMAVGGTFDPEAVTGSNWDAFAVDCGFTPGSVRLALREMAAKIAVASSSLGDELRGTQAWSDRIDVAIGDIRSRALAVPGMLQRESGAPDLAEDDEAERGFVFS